MTAARDTAAPDPVAQLRATGGTRAITADLHARVERYLTPNLRADYRGAVVMHEVPHESLPRRADVLAVNFYAGRPPLVGVEIKATRADWETELRTQDKAQAFAQWCSQWWIAAPDGLIDPGELPPGAGWGLMVPHRRTTMRAAVPARTRDVEAVPQHLLVAVAKKIDSVRADAVLKATAAARNAAALAEARAAQAARDHHRGDEHNRRDAELMRELLRAAGIAPGRAWGLYSQGPDSPEGRALLAAVDGMARLQAQKAQTVTDLRAVRGNLARVVERLSVALEAAGDPTEADTDDDYYATD